MGVPSVTRSSSAATEHQYKADLDETKFEVFSGQGNLYGFVVEDNSGSAVFLSVFDAAAIGDVTLGVTEPKFTLRIPASSAVGKDPSDSPYRFFAEGCIVAVVSTRDGVNAPGAPASAQFWSWNK